MSKDMSKSSLRRGLFENKSTKKRVANSLPDVLTEPSVCLLIYMIYCGIHDIDPLFDEEFAWTADLYSSVKRLGEFHKISSLIGAELKRSNLWEQIPTDQQKYWNEMVAKTKRSHILMDIEKQKLYQFMDEKGIWHVSLKGIVLCDLYPSREYRQMADNDILFDRSYRDEVRKYMECNGYTTAHYEKVDHETISHDTYRKQPIYNFELHTSLVGKSYSSDIDKVNSLIGNLEKIEGSSERMFVWRDFYLFFLIHTLKHYSGGGMGVRALADNWLLLKKKEIPLDEVEEWMNSINEKEFYNNLCHLTSSLFSIDQVKSYNEYFATVTLSDSDTEMLVYMLYSGAYGTQELRVRNNLKKAGIGKNKNRFNTVRYLWSRLFLRKEYYEKLYAYTVGRPYLLPVAFFHRIIARGFKPRILREIRILFKR